MAHSSPPPGLWSGPVGFLGELKAFACLVDPTPWARPRLADLFSFHEPRPTAVEPCTICQAVPHPTDWPGSSPATLETWPNPSSRDLQNWTKKQRKRAQQTEGKPRNKGGEALQRNERDATEAKQRENMPRTRTTKRPRQRNTKPKGSREGGNETPATKSTNTRHPTPRQNLAKY